MQIENNKEEIPFAHYEAKFKELSAQGTNCSPRKTITFPMKPPLTES